jgi:tetratricopeptide (TPR) repeat protein
MTIFTMKWFAVTILGSLLGGGSWLEAQSASELLQKGIYLQETMGDLDGAIKIYKQVGQMAQQSRADAAQAQYRLGLCLERKGQQSEAARTFQKLTELYPDQADLVAKVKANLPSGLKLLPAPWVDGEILDFNFTMGNMPPDSAVNWRYVVRSSKTHPGSWTFEQRIFSPVSMFNMQVDAERDTMRPVVSRMTNDMFPETLTTYRSGEARLEIKGKDPKTLKLDGSVFDENELVPLLRRLPLTAGYKNSFPVLANPGAAVSTLRFSVAAEESVKTPAGEFNAYRVELEGGATYWISTDPRHYPVKFEQTSVMSGQLSAIRRDDESSTYRNDKLGFSINVPVGWTAVEFTIDSKLVLQLVESDSLAVVDLTVEPAKPDAPPTATAMRAEAEEKAGEKHYSEQTMRADSWQTRQIGGRPGASWIADSTDMFSKTPCAVYTVWVWSGASRAELTARVDPKEFDAMRARIDDILNTLILR